MQNAIEKVVNGGVYVTPDLNPDSKYGTKEMGQAIVDAMS
jgi:isocitrate dehydrogenase (NAD+)